jgi:hypothetical protein
LSLEGKSFHILTPKYSGMSMVNYESSMTQLIDTTRKYGVSYSFSSTYNESLITRARNRLVDEFMKSSSCTHAVFIDADIGFNPDDLFRMLDLDLDIAGAPCVKKVIDWPRIVQAIRKNPELPAGELANLGGQYVFHLLNPANQLVINQPIEVSVIGTGLMMIRRNVFEDFKEQYPDRWYESKNDPAALPGPTWNFFRVGIDQETREYDSEDYCFCKDCRKIGFKVWMCPWMRTSHQGTYTFLGDIQALGNLGISL